MSYSNKNKKLVNYRESPGEYNKAKVNEDVVATVIGDFGRWQLNLSIMMALLKFPIAWYQLNIIFLAPPQEFWCVKPEAFSKYSVNEWRDMCAPRIEEFPCLIFDPEVLIIAPKMDRGLIPLVECPKFEYNQSVFTRTITSDWDLVCTKRWLIHFTQCITMCGILFGCFLFGFIADKYGRKTPLMMAVVIQAAASFVVCFMFNFNAYLFSTFVLATASGGVGIISFVLTMEVVSGKWRTIIPVIYQLPFGLANPTMACLAYWLRDWRKLMCALSVISSMFILFWPWITESPRWLLATGDEKAAYGNPLVVSNRAPGMLRMQFFLSSADAEVEFDAEVPRLRMLVDLKVLNPRIEVLKAAAIVNKMEFKGDAVKLMIANAHGKANRIPGFTAFLKSKNMRLKTFLLSVNWFFTGVAFYTLSQYLGNIGDNIFHTVAISGLISTPGAIVCVFIITKKGRKLTVAIFEIATALCFLFILIMPTDSFLNDWPRIVFAGIGFGGMAGSVPALFLYSGELFPTLGRNVGVSGVSTFARIGSMVAPAVASLNEVVPDLPIMILAVTSFAQILLLLPLPETMNHPLPDTLEQAEHFTRYSTGAKKKYGLFD